MRWCFKSRRFDGRASKVKCRIERFLFHRKSAGKNALSEHDIPSRVSRARVARPRVTRALEAQLLSASPLAPRISCSLSFFFFYLPADFRAKKETARSLSAGISFNVLYYLLCNISVIFVRLSEGSFTTVPRVKLCLAVMGR